MFSNPRYSSAQRLSLAASGLHARCRAQWAAEVVIEAKLIADLEISS